MLLVAKTLNWKILNRIQAEMEKQRRNNQNGFRERRSNTSHILMLRRILEGTTVKSHLAVMIFIDFWKVFDSVDRHCLIKILQAYGISKKIQDLISLLYTNTRTQVVTPDGMTEFFEIMARVLQGHTSAPYRFFLSWWTIVCALRWRNIRLSFTVVLAQSRRVKAKKIPDAEFADDIVLVTNTTREAEELMQEVETVSMSVELKMNEIKMKYLVENIKKPEKIMNVGRKSLELVQDFLYLGAKIENTEGDIVERKSKAYTVCHSLRSVWTSDIRKDLKIRLCCSGVSAVVRV
ncbi:uncharacterized protein LOC106878509 [Octopus bimaculoides]|uniref:uncharacterized protein LOC106878509 n=1 Tax=Octopus bimaculoides TaxID=37653 RepID=UPI00071DB919|nr:uncharacterized protein LOC106878509 [Octopus bimaculoides]|eukprot:XP_014783219.1 PREDICTED: uncharacterized protein LOC106878509 [Octopus bimaculoides]